MKKYFRGCLNIKIADSFISLQIKEEFSLKKIFFHDAEAERPSQPRPRPVSIDYQRRWVSNGLDKSQHLSNYRLVWLQWNNLPYASPLKQRDAQCLHFHALWPGHGNEWNRSPVNKRWTRSIANLVNAKYTQEYIFGNFLFCYFIGNWACFVVSGCVHMKHLTLVHSWVKWNWAATDAQVLAMSVHTKCIDHSSHLTAANPTNQPFLSVALWLWAGRNHNFW